MEVYAAEIDELKQKIAGLEDQLAEAGKPGAVLSNSTDGLAGIPKRGQRQDALRDQLFDLRKAANKLGLYDAADYLAACMTRDNNYLAR